MDHQYRIGEIAELFGITKEGIRYLERKGLIHSVRNDDNGYRFFDRTSVATLKTIRTYERLGLSLNEIYDCMSEKDEQEILYTLQDHCEALQREIDEKQAMLDELKLRSDLLRRFNEDKEPRF